MPFTLRPVSRRRFLTGSLAAAAASVMGAKLFGAPPTMDPHRFAFLADVHIAARPDTLNGQVNMTDNFKSVCRELIALEPQPAAIFITGDLAYQNGESGDYAAFFDLLKPIRDAGTPVHLALGNHDHRERFWNVLPVADREPSPVPGRHVTVVKTPRANFFILDSLHQTNKTPGRCGDAQLRWLAAALDAHADKPAITVVHHHTDWNALTGLLDTDALLNVLLPRKQVKAHIFGHTHRWTITKRSGFYLVNLPPTGFLLARNYPIGWLDMQLADDHARIELHTLDPNHPAAHQRLMLQWR